MMKLTKKEIQSAIEAILFAGGEPITISRLSDVLEKQPEEISKLTEQLAKEYEERKSGL